MLDNLIELGLRNEGLLVHARRLSQNLRAAGRKRGFIPSRITKKRQQGTASLASHARPAAAQNISQQDSAPAISQTVLAGVSRANPFARRARKANSAVCLALGSMPADFPKAHRARASIVRMKLSL